MQRAVPDRIQVPNGLAGAMESVLGSLEDDAGFRPETVIEEVTPEEGAEWVFDDFITQIAGRQSAEDRPGLGRPGHVYALFECVLRGGMT